MSKWWRRGGVPADDPGSADLPVTATFDAADLARDVSADLLTSTIATDDLWSRLDEHDLSSVHAAMSEADEELCGSASDGNRKRSLISYAVHYRISGAVAKLGLGTEFPPDELHAMSRGPLVIMGSCYYADLVAEALRGAGADLYKVRAGLDFGCSSGRVVRALAAANASADWYGCDPIPESIAWASEHLPNIRFDVSQSIPPLAYADATFDFVCAISIWSHFAEPAALRWLDEMHRVMKPGGFLVITTHGLQSIPYWEGNRLLYTPEHLDEIKATLYRNRYWFMPFGEAGDWGVIDPQWGHTFFTPEWLLSHISPKWMVANYAAGRVEGNQDIYTLIRR